MAYQFDVDATRSRTMSRIRSRDTTPEIVLRRALWKRGVRYRKNYRRAPGTPDIAIVGRKIAVFVDGEFWHGYNWERKKTLIKANRDYWIPKIERTITRDREAEASLEDAGWTVLRFWSHEVKQDLEGCVDRVLSVLSRPASRTPTQGGRD